MSLLLKDKRIRLALGLVVLEWVIIGGLIARYGEDNLGLAGVVLVLATWLQLGVLFRRARGPRHDAQAAYLRGDFAAVVEQLEALDAPDVPAQTLLGNTYRLQGRLAESERTLRAALVVAPDDPFPLYGLGRTLLAGGQYADAAEVIAQALAQRGRKAIRCELALAAYLAGDHAGALEAAQRASRVLNLEPYRSLMVNYLLHTLTDDARAPALIQHHIAGLDYWRAEAERFASTPYGQDLRTEIGNIEQVVSA